MLLRFSVANMVACKNEPYHDESYHPILVMVSAAPMTSNTAQGIETSIQFYSEEFEVTASQGTYEELASESNGGGARFLHTDRKDYTCSSLCKEYGCSYCISNDVYYGLKDCSCRRRLEQGDEEDRRDRELETSQFTSNLNCFTPLQYQDCAKLKASVDLSAQDARVPVREVKCFLLPTPAAR
jgi:hypothetical protein